MEILRICEKLNIGMNINERFSFIINELYGGNKRAFSIALGLTPTVIENVVGKRQGKPSFDVIEKVCANANISGDWLILGEGSMLKTETPLKDTSNDVLTPENGVLNTLKGIIKEQALEIARLELEVENLKNRINNG